MQALEFLATDLIWANFLDFGVRISLERMENFRTFSTFPTILLPTTLAIKYSGPVGSTWRSKSVLDSAHTQNSYFDLIRTSQINTKHKPRPSSVPMAASQSAFDLAANHLHDTINQELIQLRLQTQSEQNGPDLKDEVAKLVQRIDKRRTT